MDKPTKLPLLFIPSPDLWVKVSAVLRGELEAFGGRFLEKESETE
jgi:hypothetical protein